MQYLRTILKAITAGLAVIAGAIAVGTINAEPWVESIIMAVIAMIGVYLVPNKA